MRHISSSISSDELIRHFCHRTSIRHVPNIDKGTTILGEYQAKKMIFLNFDTAWIYAGYFKDIVSSNKTREKGEKKRRICCISNVSYSRFFKKCCIPIPLPISYQYLYPYWCIIANQKSKRNSTQKHLTG